jgi:hypothetical protein
MLQNLKKLRIESDKFRQKSEISWNATYNFKKFDMIFKMENAKNSEFLQRLFCGFEFVHQKEHKYAAM